MLGLQPRRTIRAVYSAHHGLQHQHRRFSGKSLLGPPCVGGGQRLRTLAIETSCDDTSVAILSVSTSASNLRTDVLFHERVTADSKGYGGIHPLVALHSHQQQLGPLVQRALQYLGPNVSSTTSMTNESTKPDFVTVTRGPGMRSNLSVGLDTAKGLALAWNVPLLGVHHMQAHALTPRLCSTIRSRSDPTKLILRPNGESTSGWSPDDLSPGFPFLSVLASGGHSMLIDSKSLTAHKILAESGDIAIGDCLDKAARAILPPDELKPPYGKALEEFAFPNGTSDYNYVPPARRQEELERRITKWGWGLLPPLAETKTPEKSSRRMVYSFAGILTYVQRLVASKPECPVEERRELAREVMRVAFEHLASRILLHFSSLSQDETSSIKTVVVSGGVASNSFLRHLLRSILDVRGFRHLTLEFPPPELCTDNALMIAWAGMEMYDAGYQSNLDIQPVRKWSMDPAAEDGGILGVGGWKHQKRKNSGEPS